MGRYRKIETRTWADEKFTQLTAIPPCGQGLWLYLMTGPQTGPIPGLFRAGRAAMAEDLDWSLEAFDKAFLEISSRGMAKADFKAKLVWLPRAIRYNMPESPNVVKSWRGELESLPECDLKHEAIAAFSTALKILDPTFLQAYDGLFKPLVKPLPKPEGKDKSKQDGKSSRKASAKALPNQEQEQEQEQEPEQGGGNARANAATDALAAPPPLTVEEGMAILLRDRPDITRPLAGIENFRATVPAPKQTAARFTKWAATERWTSQEQPSTGEDRNTRAAVEAEAKAKGMPGWNELEQWSVYLAKVRACASDAGPASSPTLQKIMSS